MGPRTNLEAFQKKCLLPLPRIETRMLICPAPSLTIVQTALQRVAHIEICLYEILFGKYEEHSVNTG